MDAKELASQLDGSEYPFDLGEAHTVYAKENGLVVVCGASDDLMEFYGAFRDEVGAYEGTTVRIGPLGLLPDYESIDKDNRQSKDVLRAYFLTENAGRTVKAIWSQDGYSWQYKTDIPHSSFEIVEEGEKYCKGIVFRLADCI